MANSQVQITVGVDATGVQQGMNAAAQAAGQVGNQATRATQRAAAATNTWQQGLQRIRAQARLFGADIIGRLSATIGVMALFDRMVLGVTENLKRMGEISRNAAKAGLNAEEYQRVSRVAEETGASVDEAAEAAGRYARMIREAAAGNEEARQSLLDLGYTDSQVRRGNISTIDVLARLSAQYRAARTEAERLRIEKESGVSRPILEAGPAAVVIAGGRSVTAQAEVERRARDERMGKEGGGFWERAGNFFADMVRNQYGPAGQANEAAGYRMLPGQEELAFGGNRRIQEISGRLKEEGLPEEERGRLEAELIGLFAEYAQRFRDTFQGSIQGGKVQTLEDVNKELERKLGELMPRLKTPEGGLPVGGTPATAKDVAQGVSSLQAIGGGGGYAAGDMVSLATRTAEATERAAASLETLANARGGISQPPSPVSAD